MTCCPDFAAGRLPPFEFVEQLANPLNKADGILGVIRSPQPSGILAAIEIGPQSDVDAVLVTCKEGTFLVSMGAPLVGPVTGPFTVGYAIGSNSAAPFSFFARRVVDGNGDQRAETRSPMPRIALRCHQHMPSAFFTRRAPAERRMEPFALTNSYVAILEIPVWGRKRGSIFLTRSSAQNLTYKFTGRLYIEDPVTALITPSDSDMTGDLTQSSTTVAWTWSDDTLHSIIVYAKYNNSTTNLGVYSRAVDDT